MSSGNNQPQSVGVRRNQQLVPPATRMSERLSNRRHQFQSNIPSNSTLNQNPNENVRQNRRFYGQNNRHYRPRRGSNEVNSAHNVAEIPQLISPPVLPGFIYDHNKKKYFKIAEDTSGLSGYTRSDVLKARRDKERRAQLSNIRPRFASESFVSRPVIRPTTSMMQNLSMCGRSFNPAFERRRLEEARLLNAKSAPNSIQDVPLSELFSMRGCQFLSVSSDGKSMLGCWAAVDRADEHDSHRDASYILCLQAQIDEEKRNKALVEQDRRPSNVIEPLLDTMGLTFSKLGHHCEVSGAKLVDMCIAPVDSDVTCCLYVTAATRLCFGGLRTRCSIFLQPIAEWSTPEYADMLNSPIYNGYWNAEASIWSCGWSANSMRVALGLEDCAKIMNVVTEQHFIISSRKKSVISQQFSQDGNLIYMGLRADNVIQSDLRMSCKHHVGTLKGSRNAGSIHLLKSAHPGCIITENFTGELKLWDSRRTDRALLNFKGHRNSHYKLPCHVDDKERFIFAVGEDGTTRGWSLTSGNLLCAVPSPRPIEQRTDFPRVVYSDCWAGRSGHAALVLAVDDTCRVHQLDL